MTQLQQPSPGDTSTPQPFNRQEEPALSQSQPPLSHQPAAWKVYWQNQGQPWRTEPEINAARQEVLESRSVITSDPQQGIYPFKDVNLSRADLEWLLATHEKNKGPVDWQDKAQQRREGLDIRGAVLSDDTRESVNLSGLPLARLQGGLARHQWNGWAKVNQDLLTLAAVDLEGVDLSSAHLEGASLTRAHLKQADLRLACLEKANLTGAQLEEANLTGAQLEEANLTGAQLGKTYLTGAQLTKANLHGAQLKQAILFGTQLKDAYLVGAQLEGANLTGAQLEGANLRQARLGRAILSGSLAGTDLTEAILADEQGIGPRLAAVQWGTTDLSTVDWLSIKQLDDECIAYQEGRKQGAQKDALAQLHAFKKAVKAYRQLALALRTQGLYEESAYFSYRAHVLQHEVLRRQIGAKKQDQGIGSWFFQLSTYLFALFLHLTTGYGYKPWRSIITYLLVIVLFALAYTVFGHISLLPNALVLSITEFHGRGFFSEQTAGNASIILIASESIVGLLLEISFIVVFARRFLEQ